MATCGIALGGNIDNTAEVFDAAIQRLEARGIYVAKFSSLLRTPPMGTNAGGDFVNAAAVVETQLTPIALLNFLHEIESDLGRIRDIHWGPRRLDLDLLYHDQTVICTDKIVVPHPSFWYRRFVLQPLAEIAPDYLHPILNQSISQLHQRLNQRPLRFAISGQGVSESIVADVERSLATAFHGHVRLALSDSRNAKRDDPFAFIVVDPEAPKVDFQQPQHEPNRTIRVCGEGNDLREKLQSALTDICAAVIG